MKTNALTSFIGELTLPSSRTESVCSGLPAQYQVVAQEIGATPTSEPSSSSSALPPPSPQSLQTVTAACQPSKDPIWDTGWEIEPNEPELGLSAMAALRGLFSKNGLADETVKLSYIEELAVCPGVRSWVNRSVVVEYPNGQLEKFSAEWTAKRPEWTLCSMLERMGAEGPVQVVT